MLAIMIWLLYIYVCVAMVYIVFVAKSEWICGLLAPSMLLPVCVCVWCVCVCV